MPESFKRIIERKIEEKKEEIKSKEEKEEKREIKPLIGLLEKGKTITFSELIEKSGKSKEEIKNDLERGKNRGVIIEPKPDEFQINPEVSEKEVKKERKREYAREYSKRPEVKKKRREYKGEKKREYGRIKRELLLIDLFEMGEEITLKELFKTSGLKKKTTVKKVMEEWKKIGLVTERKENLFLIHPESPYYKTLKERKEKK